MTMIARPRPAAGGLFLSAPNPAATAAPELSIVVPTYKERENIAPLVQRLAQVLEGIRWEVVFVDDDSPDGTAVAIRRLARRFPQVRLYPRIGRRGLAGACVEGMLSSVAPLIAVIDADLQHDEGLLAAMLAAFAADPGLDLVIGSRARGAAGLAGWRRWASGAANAVARHLLGRPVSDPMSGFFMLRRRAFNSVVPELRQEGFKILLDMLLLARGRWQLREMPYAFRPRARGRSKLDLAVGFAFLRLILIRLCGGGRGRGMLLGLCAVVILWGAQLALIGLGARIAGSGALALGLLVLPAAVVAAAAPRFLPALLRRGGGAVIGQRRCRPYLRAATLCLLGVVADVALADALAQCGVHWMAAALAGASAATLWCLWALLPEGPAGGRRALGLWSGGGAGETEGVQAWQSAI